MGKKKIIIPVIAQEVVKKTIPSVAEWIEKIGNDVEGTLLYTIDSYDMDSATLALADMKIKENYLEELVQEYSLYGVEVKPKIRVGAVAEETAKEALESEALAILICTDNRRKIFNALQGNLIDQVIKRAPCPVVVLKPKLLKLTESGVMKISSGVKKLSAKEVN